VLGAPRAVAAHATLVEADPPDLCADVRARTSEPRCATGAVLASPPPAIRLTFSERVQPIGAGLRVTGPRGRRAERGPVRAGARSLDVDVDATEPGTYRVSWRVVSSDGQPVRGAFAFSVGRSTPEASSADDGGAWQRIGFAAGIVGRAMHFVGIAVAFGTLVFRATVLRPLGIAGAPAVEAALSRLIGRGLTALLVAEPVIVLGHALTLGVVTEADVLPDLLASRAGLVAGQRLGIALALWAMLAALEARSRVALGLALALGAVLAVVDGQAAHAMSVRPVVAGLVVNALHIAAMAVWLGVVAPLVAVWRRLDAGDAACPRGSRLGDVSSLRQTVIARAGRAAAAAAVVAIGTGALLTFQHLAHWSDLTSTAYGRVLVAKLAALMLVLAFAATARRRAVRAPERWWRREIAGLIALLLLAAALMSLTPPA
jgi:copper transport protein